jgi:hypothetical protein
MFLRFVSGAHPAHPLILRRQGRASCSKARAITGRMAAAKPAGSALAERLLSGYYGILVPNQGVIIMAASVKRIEIERVQTGVRMERRILKVLKALAEYKNISLGDLLEGIVLHAFEGKAPFAAETVRKIAELKNIYELDLDARASHRLKEKP